MARALEVNAVIARLNEAMAMACALGASIPQRIRIQTLRRSPHAWVVAAMHYFALTPGVTQSFRDVVSDPGLAITRSADSEAISNSILRLWPAPGSADTELGVLMEPEVCHGKTEVYTRVQA